MKALALLLVFASYSLAQLTSIFPGRAVTDQDMGVVTDQGQSNLTGPVSATALTIPVANGLAFQAFNIPVIEGEKILVCSVSPSALTVCPNGRGYDGTVAMPHGNTKPIYNTVHSTFFNRDRLEIEALQALWFAGGDATIVNGRIRLTRATPFYSMPFSGQQSIAVPAGVHQQGCAVIAAAYDTAGQAILGGINVDGSCNVIFTFASPQTGSYIIIGGGGTGISTNATQFQGVNVTNTAPTTNQVMLYNGTNWLPSSIASTILTDTSNIMRTTTNETVGAFSYDFSGAAHTLPAKKGLNAAKPVTCSLGEEYFATDVTAGQNKFYCTASNTWTQQTGGGGSGTVTAVTGTGAIVSSGGTAPAISCPTCLTGVTGTANQITSSGGTTPVLSLPNVLTVGMPGALSQLSFFGDTSGTAIIQPQSVAGTPTLTLPNLSGTFAANATAPLTLSSTTGTLTCNTCVTAAAPLTNGKLVTGGGGQASQSADLTGDTKTSGGTVTLTDQVNGTTIPTNAAADQALITTAAATGAWKAVPSCLDTAGQHLNYNTSTHVFVCGTSGGTAGSAAFNTISSGTNTTAAMVCDTGCSVAPANSGTITATAFSGVLAAANLPNPSATTLGGVRSYAAVSNQWINAISTLGVPSSTQPAFTDISGSVAASQLPNPSASTLGGVQSLAAASNKWINAISTSGVPSSTQPAFTDISGTVAAGQMPTFTGDMTNVGLATTVGKLNGTTLSGLATGLLKNTTATGVPSIATAKDLSGVLNCIAASASGTAYTCTTSPSFTPASGDSVNLKADVANTASATLNVNGAGAHTITKQAGSANLIANDLRIGSWQVLTYDGTNWQENGLLGNSGAGSGTVNSASAGNQAFYSSSGTIVGGLPNDFHAEAFATVKAAVDAAVAAGGGNVYLSTPGTYTVANTINMGSSTARVHLWLSQGVRLNVTITNHTNAFSMWDGAGIHGVPSPLVFGGGSLGRNPTIQVAATARIANAIAAAQQDGSIQGFSVDGVELLGTSGMVVDQAMLHFRGVFSGTTASNIATGNLFGTIGLLIDTPGGQTITPTTVVGVIGNPTVTVTVPASTNAEPDGHDVWQNGTVTVAGCSEATYNGTGLAVASVTDNTHFTYTAAGNIANTTAPTGCTYHSVITQNITSVIHLANNVISGNQVAGARPVVISSNGGGAIGDIWSHSGNYESAAVGGAEVEINGNGGNNKVKDILFAGTHIEGNTSDTSSTATGMMIRDASNVTIQTLSGSGAVSTAGQSLIDISQSGANRTYSINIFGVTSVNWFNTVEDSVTGAGVALTDLIVGEYHTPGHYFTGASSGMTYGVMMGNPLGMSIGTVIASAATIAPKAPLTHVSGTTTISTITAPPNLTGTGYGGCIRLIPDGIWATNTAGNIALASTAVVSKVLEECYDSGTSKWYPSY